MSWKTVFVSMIAAAVISFTVAKLTKPDGAIVSAVKKENLYDRIIGTGEINCGYVIWPNGFEIDPVTGKKSGINHDIAEDWAKRLGLKINWKAELIPGQHIQDLNSGKVDANCTCDGPFTYRAASQIDYSKPFAYYGTYLYGRKEDVGKYKTVDDFNNKNVTFSTLDGDASAIIAYDNFPKAKKLPLAGNADPSLIVENVLTKKADVVILDTFTAIQVGDKLGYLERLLPDKLAIFSCSFGVRKGETELLQMMNQGIDLISNLGEIEGIAKKNGADGQFLYPAYPYRGHEKYEHN